MSAPAGQAARRLAPAGAAALAGLAAGDRTEALRDRPTESEEVPLAGSWLEIGLKPGDVDVDGGLEILAPAAVETIPAEALASEANDLSLGYETVIKNQIRRVTGDETAPKARANAPKSWDRVVK